MSKLLVIGAKNGSLGYAIANQARSVGEDVATAGVSGDEDMFLDISYGVMESVFGTFDEVVCTVGINLESVIGSDGFYMSVKRSVGVNAVSIITFMEQWVLARQELKSEVRGAHNFVVISSNSAHVARSQSVGYCMSKAALSMGVRCMARQLAGDHSFNIWGYEPGWIHGTPMSGEVQERIPLGAALHRIPGGRSGHRAAIAARIMSDIVLARGGFMGDINGTMFRLDGGDQ